MNLLIGLYCYFPIWPVFSRVWSGFVECGHDYLLATWSMAYVYNSIFSVRVCAFLFMYVNANVRMLIVRCKVQLAMF